MKLSAACVFAVVAATAATASAESYDAAQPVRPADGYVGAGAAIGGARAIKLGMFVDGGKRLGDSVLFARGQMTGGASGTDGSYTQFRAGIEARGCVANQLICGFIGTDAGYQRDHMVDQTLFSMELETVDAHDLILVPRAGLEVGRKIRLRSSIEAPLYQRLNAPSGEMSASENRGGGVMVTLGVAGIF